MKRFTTVIARRASFHAVASVTSVNHAWRLCASNNVAAPGGDPAVDFQASTVASTTLAAPVSSVSPTPSATPAGAAPQSLNGIAVFVVDLDVKQVGPLGVDYDPAEFILSLLEVKADQSHRTAKLSFKGVNDAEALSKCRKFVYPADAEATGAKVTLSPDVMIDAQGNATGGREIIYVPTTRTPVVALRSVVARFAAGKHTLLPLWRLPGGADGGDDLSDVSGLRTFARKLDSNCHIDGGFLGSVARLLSRAAATNVPLDSVADRPSQTLPVRHFTAADAATRMQFPPPSVPFVTPQKSIKDELAASTKAASTPLGDASAAVDTGKVKVAKTVKRGANVAKATPPSTPDVATSAAVAEVPAAAELTPDAATTPTDAPSDDAVASPPSVKPTAPRKKRATPPSTSAAATTAEAAKQDELQTPTTPSRKQQATAATKAARVKKGAAAKAVAKKTPVSKKPAITKKASSGKTVKKSGKIVALKKKSASKSSAASKKKLVKKALAKKKDRLNKKVSAGSKTKAPPSKPKKATAKRPTFAKKAKLSIRAPSAAKKSSARPAKPKKTTTTTKNKTAQKKKKKN